MADLGFGHIKAGNARTGSRGRSAGMTFEGKQRNRFVRADALYECGEVTVSCFVMVTLMRPMLC